MAGTRVDPPPLNVAVVDGRGFPTPPLRDFLHRLWIRTGGHDNELTTLMSILTNGGYLAGQGQSEERVEQDVVQLSLQGSGASALREEIGSLLGLMQAQAQRHASEIAALREEVDALRHAKGQRSSNAESAQAAEDANTAQVLLFTHAMPQGTPY